jgi:hypothetical protein
MNAKTAFITALLATALSSGAALAGKGPGGGGGSMGQGAQHRSMQDDMSRGQGQTGQHRSERALQQDRDMEQYRGPDAERDKQKAKAKQFGKQSGGSGRQ